MDVKDNLLLETVHQERMNFIVKQILLNTKHSFAKLIPNWVIATMEISVALLMVGISLSIFLSTITSVAESVMAIGEMEAVFMDCDASLDMLRFNGKIKPVY
jgi:hypothetical protein